MRFDADQPGRLLLRDGTATVADYVFDLAVDQRESPRPFLRLRTRSGADASGHRPADHVWHSGLSLALPVVGAHNFWGGPTYVHGQGYVFLPNNGVQRHRKFTALDNAHDARPARLVERLDWIAEDGAPVLTEQRTLTARGIGDTAWALTWHSILCNASRGPLALGSPATKGRTGAGYGGIFWRGPAEFSGGAIDGPSGPVGDAACGAPAAWLAFTAPDRSARVLLLDGAPAGSPWFARSAEYAGLGPAPFFHTEHELPVDGRLVLSAAVVIGAGDVAALAPTVGAALVADLRSRVDIPEDDE